HPAGNLTKIRRYRCDGHLAEKARPGEVEQGINHFDHAFSGTPTALQMIARVWCQILPLQQQPLGHDDRAERIAQIVTENSHHPFPERNRFAESPLCFLLLGNVSRGPDQTNDFSSVVVDGLECLTKVSTVPARNGHVSFFKDTLTFLQDTVQQLLENRRL